MKKIFSTRLFIALLIGFSVRTVFATSTISGEVNHYAKVVSVMGCGVHIDSVGKFQIGDQVLLIQMKGASIKRSDAPDYGQVTSYGAAGKYEVHEVVQIMGNELYFKHQIQTNFNPNYGLQVVGFRSDTDVLVNGAKAKPWNGETGGIIFITAQNTIFINDDLIADGTGFRGGKRSKKFVTCPTPEYEFPTDTKLAGNKGEGIVPFYDMYAGRGAAGNGGGGGNNHNAGGGGGSNIGAGGQGGDSYYTPELKCTPDPVGGKGGYPIPTDSLKSRIMLGGGGGGGQQNDSTLVYHGGTHGGAGGGIIFLQAEEITAIGNRKISANGLSPSDTATNDGAGGGGAGGSIIINTNSYQGDIKIEANGGQGGSLNNRNIYHHCHGPGGGGGGGRIQSSIALPTNVVSEANSGEHGKVLNTNSVCYGTPYGSFSGVIGLSYMDNMPPVVSTLCPENNIDAIDDYYSGTTPTIFDIEPLLNDIYPGQVDFSLLSPLPPEVTLQNTNLNFNYKRNDHGIKTLEYKICMTQAPYLCDSATIYLDIKFLNNPPIAINDTIRIKPGEIKNLLPLFNDYDPDGDTIRLQSMNTSNEYTVDYITELVSILVNDKGQHIFPYEICDHYGECSQGEIVVILNQDDELEIPGGFSPNDDDINDYFEIINLDQYQQVNVKIFNRWGQIIFEDTRYENDWDGTGDNGQELPDGTYFYSVTPDNLKTFTGYVIIHR